MNRRFRVQGIDLGRYRVGPLAPFIDGFAARLSELQYQRETARRKFRAVADLSLWLARERRGARSLDERAIRRFFEHHHRYDSFRSGDVSAGMVMLGLLREQGVAPPHPARIDRRHAVEKDFERFLREERRLSQASLDNSLPFVRRFLAQRFGRGPIVLKELAASDVTEFVLQSIRTCSPSRAKLLVGALRSFFRFLLMRGEIAADLAGAVPTVADWRLSTVPKGIERGEVQRLLRSCDCRTTPGRRDYAVLLLLARLGLRAGEVAALTLDDIDWKAGEISVRGKGPRLDRLPLPPDVGKALVAYLHRRPQCATRQVFLTVRAPVGELADHRSVSAIVERGLTRAGLDPPRKGAHVLRHALASDMLRRGASLPEIGELLRHRRLDTTAIYAKVDLGALRALAQPWPGGAA